MTATQLHIFSDFKVLRKIFGHKKNKEAVDRRELHREDLHNLCSSPTIVRLMKLTL
jgi:hypothetical protein